MKQEARDSATEKEYREFPKELGTRVYPILEEGVQLHGGGYSHHKENLEARQVYRNREVQKCMGLGTRVSNAPSGTFRNVL
jgi:hypothetical protein